MPGFAKRMSLLTQDQRESEIHKKIAGTSQQICEADDFWVIAAETNATEWRIESYQLVRIDIDSKIKELEARLTYRALGLQDTQKESLGSRINGAAKAIIDDEGKVIAYVDITAEMVAG